MVQNRARDWRNDLVSMERVVVCEISVIEAAAERVSGIAVAVGPSAVAGAEPDEAGPPAELFGMEDVVGDHVAAVLQLEPDRAAFAAVPVEVNPALVRPFFKIMPSGRSHPSRVWTDWMRISVGLPSLNQLPCRSRIWPLAALPLNTTVFEPGFPGEVFYKTGGTGQIKAG